MINVADHLTKLRQQLAQACTRAGRPADSVRLLAVSKTQAPAAIAALAAAGQTAFGENYLQEADSKIAAAEALAGTPLEWHFIGPLQSNKTAGVARRFDWAHGIERLKIAQRLSAQRPDARPPLEVCVQVNVSGEISKSGCAPAQAAALCAAVAALPKLRLRGLMCIPEALDNAAAARPAFARLRQLFEQIRAAGAVDPTQFDTLSMGMSGDYEVAIEEGATLVRIGSALFGPRVYGSPK